MRALDFQKGPAKKAIITTGNLVYLTHLSGEPTWSGEDGQTPTYNSGVSAVYCRAIPFKEDIILGEQTYGAMDLHAWFPYDVTVELGDSVIFSGTQLDGSYFVGSILRADTVIETYLKRQS